MILLALPQQLSPFPLCAPQSSQWTANYGPGFALLLPFNRRSQSLIVALEMRLSEYDCPRVHDILIIGRLFLIKNTHLVLDSFHWFFFSLFFKRICATLCGTLFPLLHFLPALSPLVCFPSTFELCIWQFMSSLCEQLPSFRPSGCWEPHIHLPAVRQADELGGRKWTPISHHLCCGVSLKARGIRLTFQLWMCASVCLCVPDNLLFGRVTSCTELETRPFRVSPADSRRGCNSDRSAGGGRKTHQEMGEMYKRKWARCFSEWDAVPIWCPSHCCDT